MADLYNNYTNIKIEDDRDLDRIAKLLQDYTKDTENSYIKLNSENIIKISSYIYWGQLLVLFISPLPSIFFLFFLFNYFEIKLTHNTYVFIGVIIMCLNLVFTSYFYRKTSTSKIKNNIATLSISQKRLEKVIEFASQTLEHQSLTDIRKFEFQLLLKEAEEMLIRCKEITKT